MLLNFKLFIHKVDFKANRENLIIIRILKQRRQIHQYSHSINMSLRSMKVSKSLREKIRVPGDLYQNLPVQNPILNHRMTTIEHIVTENYEIDLEAKLQKNIKEAIKKNLEFFHGNIIIYRKVIVF